MMIFTKSQMKCINAVGEQLTAIEEIILGDNATEDQKDDFTVSFAVIFMNKFDRKNIIEAIKQFWKPINTNPSVQPAPDTKKLAPSLNQHSFLPADINSQPSHT